MLTAVLVVTFACAAPKTVATIQSPTPSPSPTPTTPMQASGPGFHVGEVGVSYAPVALAATGGVQPYHWTVSAGALPPGLTVGADGSISGNPTGAGDYTFTIQAADSGDSNATVSGKISIASHLSLNLLPACSTYCYVELGCDSACGNYGQLIGGVQPFHTDVIDGTVPSGTSLNGLSLTGNFGGNTGWLQFTVRVSDALGVTADLSPKFWMLNHVSVVGGACKYVQLPCTVTLQYSGGSGDVTLRTDGWSPGQCGYAAPSPCPEPPITGSGSGGTLNITIGPISPNSYPYPTGTYTIHVTDQAACSSGTPCASGTVSLTLVWTG